MAHEVETMAFAHEVPWHGLGVPVPADTAPDDMARLAGIDWAVEKRPIFTTMATNEQREADPMALDMQIVRGKKALTRVTDGKVFDVVGDRWNPVQNRELLATFKRFCDDGGATMETAGALKGGEIVWGLANLGNGFVLPGGDAVKGYLLLASRHQSGFATIGRVTPVRVVCANTFAMSGGFSGEAKLRVPHTQEWDADWAAEQMGLARAGMSEFEKNAKVLQSIGLTMDDAKRILVPVFQPQDDLADVMKDWDGKASRTVKAIMEAAVKGAGAVEGNAWGLFNGATFHANHKARGTADNRMASTFMGQNNANLNRLFGNLLELAD